MNSNEIKEIIVSNGIDLGSAIIETEIMEYKHIKRAFVTLVFVVGILLGIFLHYLLLY
jgi:hypothetical protein